jgi:hypothetical protein
MGAHVAQVEGVAVGGGAGTAERSGGAAGAADILHHELLAEMPREDIGNDAPVMSAGPPAANGTITVTVRVG